MNNKLLLAIGGATGSGKTALAIALAKKYPQIVILSADSRQVYRRLDVGSAKVGAPGVSTKLTGKPEPVWYVDTIAQYLIDIAQPNATYSLADYQNDAYCLIQAAWGKGLVPLLVGGTGLYIQSVTEGFEIQGEADPALRIELEGLDVATLQKRLRDVGGTIVDTDQHNKRRLIRAIERTLRGISKTDKTPLTENVQTFILERPWEQQRDLAPAMVQERLDLGLINEVKELLATGVEKEWLMTMGLSYRLVIRMLEGEFAEGNLKENMVHEFRQLMRRQATWFRRMKGAQSLDAVGIEMAIGRMLQESST